MVKLKGYVKIIDNIFCIKNILCIAIIFSFISCTHYVVNQAGYVRPPIKYRFKYKKNSVNLSNNDIIDTTAIYFLHNSSYYKNNSKYKNGDSYIRFYSDGRFKCQDIAGFPVIDDINDINKGIVGYYYLEGQLLKTQIYIDINGGTDKIEFGLINNNKDLVILNENPRSSFSIINSEETMKKRLEKSYFNPKVYKKTKISGIIYVKPNW